MAYESLYRRYRPRRFSEVRGQDDLVRALSNAVRENRVSHAYLLSGPRGTGKTTTARILAKALNCTDLQDGEPCCECASCLAIESGTSYDLLELDAASNNGVDAMRDLIAKAALGSPGRTKVYILDEVHMLSTGASNALLKTLEEPPGHVVFVLATTDPHKVLPTIRSRTQHFELHLLPASELDELVRSIISDAQLDVGEDGIQYALRAGGGSARDTLSALDQVVAAGGVLDRGDQVDELMQALIANDTAAAIAAIAQAMERGHDPRVMGEALLAKIRNVFLHRMGDPLNQLTGDARTQIEAWAGSYSDRQCTLALEQIGAALLAMRQATDTRIPLEVALVRLTRDDGDTSLEGLARRIERLEQGFSAPPATSGAPSAAPPSASPSPSTAPAPAAAPQRQAGGRPLDAARALLDQGRTADKPSKHATPPATAAPPVAAAPPEPTTSAPTPPVAAAPPAPTPSAAAPPAAAPPEPTPSAPTPSGSAAPAQSDATTLTSLTDTWTAHVLPTLGGLTKAMYSVGHFSSFDGANATFVVPNAVHQQKSEQKRGEVEAALSKALGHPLTIRLVLGDEQPSTGTDDGPRAPGNARAEPTNADIDDIGNIDELEDAPSDNRTAIDRLKDAFPGAEVVDP